VPGVAPPLLLALLDAVIAVLAVRSGDAALAAASGFLAGFWAFCGYPTVLAERAAIRERRMRGWLLRDLDSHWQALEAELRGGR
jgi:hypothetical protein